MRKPYCTGCGHTFPQMHKLINHRRTDRCGGRFLPAEQRAHLDRLRKSREKLDKELNLLRATGVAV